MKCDQCQIEGASKYKLKYGYMYYCDLCAKVADAILLNPETGVMKKITHDMSRRKR